MLDKQVKRKMIRCAALAVFTAALIAFGWAAYIAANIYKDTGVINVFNDASRPVSCISVENAGRVYMEKDILAGSRSSIIFKTINRAVKVEVLFDDASSLRYEFECDNSAIAYRVDLVVRDDAVFIKENSRRE
jgi:hypothetical protein